MYYNMPIFGDKKINFDNFLGQNHEVNISPFCDVLQIYFLQSFLWFSYIKYMEIGMENKLYINPKILDILEKLLTGNFIIIISKVEKIRLGFVKPLTQP